MFLTGEKRRLGTRTAMARSKSEIAAPIAVSSWTTEGLVGSRGSTVFLLTMVSMGRNPWRRPRSAARAGKDNQMLLVLK